MVNHIILGFIYSKLKRWLSERAPRFNVFLLPERTCDEYSQAATTCVSSVAFSFAMRWIRAGAEFDS